MHFARMPSPLVVHEIAKNAFERLRFSLQDYGGHSVADLRVFIPDRRSAGTYVPTRKGLTVDVDLLPDLEHAVRTLREAAEARPASTTPTDARQTTGLLGPD